MTSNAQTETTDLFDYLMSPAATQEAEELAQRQAQRRAYLAGLPQIPCPTCGLLPVADCGCVVRQ